jgi:hypothetical protein
VGHRSKFAALVPGTVCLVAVAAMTAAATLVPFIGRPCLVCFNSGGQPPYEATMSLLNGDDGQLVLVALISLGVAAMWHLTGRIPTASAITCLALSLTTVILGVFELNANRLEPWMTAVGPNGAVAPAPSTLQVGFFLFLGGAAISVVASLLMVPKILPGAGARVEASLHSSPS